VRGKQSVYGKRRAARSFREVDVAKMQVLANTLLLLRLLQDKRPTPLLSSATDFSGKERSFGKPRDSVSMNNIVSSLTNGSKSRI